MVVDTQQTLADCVFLTRPPPSFWLHHMYSLVWKGIEILRASHHCLTLCLQALQPSVLSVWSVPCICPSQLMLTSVELRDGNGPSKYTCHLVP